MTSATTHAFIPPAPEVYERDLPLWKLFRNGVRSSLSVWPDYAFDTLFRKNRVFGVEAVLVNDPEGLRHVMVTNSENFRRPFAVRRVARPLGGNGLFLAEGAAWRRQRRLLAPQFTPASIGVLLPHFQEAGLHLLRTVEGGARANLSQAFQDAALEAVLRALFTMPESQARAQLSALARSYVTGPGRPTAFDAIARSDTAFAFANGARNRFQQAWFGAIDQIVRDRTTSQAHGAARDLLDLLLELRDADTGEALAPTEVRDQCATMFFAGSETTARLMFWASYLLSQAPEEQSKVRAEIANYPPERVAALDDLRNWPRLRNVLLEALRLYPPIPNTLRDAIGPDQICGEPIKPNAQVWMSAWVMHRHRRFWEHPTAFVPDRFAGTPAPWVQLPAFVPFGAGPRICLGLTFALSEAQVILAHLLARYRVSLADGPAVLPIGRVTIEPSYEPEFQLQYS